VAFGQSFETTIAAARQGAEWAWTAIYGELAPSVRGYVRGNGAADPDDVTGEVFLRIVQDIARFHGDEAHFRSWVFVIAHHRVVDQRRRRIRHPESPLHDEALNLETLNPIRQATNVEREALDNLATDSVEATIRRCVPDQREVLLLRVIGGLTLQETADALGKSLGAVKALQRRGAAAIARELSGQRVSLRTAPAVAQTRWTAQRV
jgi:RNA polymerase sigma factor (sigma-70 family)